MILKAIYVCHFVAWQPLNNHYMVCHGGKYYNNGHISKIAKINNHVDCFVTVCFKENPGE